MSAIKEFLLNFTQEHHQLGHLNIGDQRIGVVKGSGYQRTELGRDNQGLISAHQLDEIPGIVEWFEHLVQNFTTFPGVPLPFAQAVQKLTGIKTDEAIQWLTANGAKLIETGTEAEIIRFLKDNPKACQYALVLGAVWGFIDENPLFIAVNAFLYLRKLKKEGRLQDRWGKIEQVARRSFGVVANVCACAFLADVGLGFFGLDLAEMVGHSINLLGLGADLTETTLFAVEIAGTASNIVDGAASLGVGFLASKLVKKGFERINSKIKNELEKILPLASYKKQFKMLIDKQVPPESLMPVIEMMEENGIYQPIL